MKKIINTKPLTNAAKKLAAFINKQDWNEMEVELIFNALLGYMNHRRMRK